MNILKAVSVGNFKKIKEIIDNIEDNDKKHSLCCDIIVKLSKKGNFNIVKYLLNNFIYKSSLDIINKISEIYICAIEFNNLEIIKYLHKNIYDIKDLGDIDSGDILYKAIKEGFLDIADYLIAQGYHIKNVDATLLAGAAADNNMKLIQYLLIAGADVNAIDNRGWTALMWAAELEHFDIVKYLVEHGANVNVMSRHLETALMYAVERGHFDIVRYLVEHGSYIMDSALLSAAQRGGGYQIVKCLVEHGADVNAQDKDGRTALMLAVRLGHLDIARYLIEHCLSKPDISSWQRTKLLLLKIKL